MTKDEIIQAIRGIGISLHACNNCITTDLADAQEDDTHWRIDHTKEIELLELLEDHLLVLPNNSVLTDRSVADYLRSKAQKLIQAADLLNVESVISVASIINAMTGYKRRLSEIAEVLCTSSRKIRPFITSENGFKWLKQGWITHKSIESQSDIPSTVEPIEAEYRHDAS